MPSLVSDFEYDIFISYRQKDNKYDGWVTEFVANLEKELEATFKEDISIYFDTNPHDGLLETYNVGKSLENKLKCLVFIPIISQIYCDPKSFAWQYEFCAFNKMAREDRFGRDIKLSNGNVASRILPVKIHDLDAIDKTLVENELGGVLRAIEFIYNEPGVNRPLKSTDNRNDNQNKTDYRNQVNKVANAIKDIVGSLESPQKAADTNARGQYLPQKPSASKSRWIIAGAALSVLLLAGWWYYQRVSIISPSILESRIAVLPFENKTNDADLDILGDMAADFITNGLWDLGIKVVTFQSSKENMKLASVSGDGDAGPDFARRTGAETLVKGRFYKQGDELIFQVQISDAQTGEVAMALPEIKGRKSDHHGLVTELKERILTVFSLRQSSSKSVLSSKASPPKLEAYKTFDEAMHYYFRDDERTLVLLKKAISEDSTFVMAYILAGFIHKNNKEYAHADSMISQIDSRFSHRSAYESLVLEHLRVEMRGPLEAVYQQAKKGFNKDPKDFLFNFHMGIYALWRNKPLEALSVFRQIDQSSFDYSNPLQLGHSIHYAITLIRINQLNEAKKVLQTIPFEKGDEETFGLLAYINSLQNKADTLDVFIHDLENRNLDKLKMAKVCRYISYGYALKKGKESQIQWAKRGLTYVRQSNDLETESMELAWALYLSGELQGALDAFERLNAKKPDVSILSQIGCIYAKLGKVDKANEKISEIQRLNNDNFRFSRSFYHVARIYASLGEKEKTMNLLRQAWEEFPYFGGTYNEDIELIDLFDNPPFQEFMKPNG